MLLDEVKIIGISQGEKVMRISITMCQWDTVRKLCDLLREDAHELGVDLSFQITSTHEDM
jgi:hypothetical protein